MPGDERKRAECKVGRETWKGREMADAGVPHIPYIPYMHV